MPSVRLREIVTAADQESVMDLRRAPGQERYLPDMEDHFEEAVRYPHARPRLFSVHDGDTLVGFAMISDGIPPAVLEADADLVGPYYLWRLLIDERYQGRGYGRATIEAVSGYVRGRPGGDVLYTSCVAGEGSPQTFYLHLGFVKTGRVAFEEQEDVLALDLRGP
jgi:diamine N-acetyltransferase